MGGGHRRWRNQASHNQFCRAAVAITLSRNSEVGKLPDRTAWPRLTLSVLLAAPGQGGNQDHRQRRKCVPLCKELARASMVQTRQSWHTLPRILLNSFSP